MEQIKEFSEKSVRTLTNDPQYFGGFLNMARHNIFSINNHIAEQFSLPQFRLSEEGHISGSFLCNNQIKNLNWNGIFIKTLRFMPVIKQFDSDLYPKEIKPEFEGKQINAMNSVLKTVFSELNDFRNDYSHYFSTEKGAERKIEILPESAEFLKRSYRLAIAYTKERMKDVFQDRDYVIAEQEEIVEPNNRITQIGVVFLASLFLTREQAFLFIGKVKGLKGTMNNAFLATREVLMNFCIRLPHEKFQNDDAKQALLLEMVNELNRCPKILYNVITEEAGKIFRPELTYDKQENLIVNSTNKKLDETDYDSYIEALTKQIRHTNRFPYFALRFADETGLFKKWRFQIGLGKLELAKYDKVFLERIEQRRIVEEANVFGKLSEFSDENKILEKIIGHCPDTVFFEQFAPHYNIINNKIALCKKTGNAILIRREKKGGDITLRLKQPLPDAFLSIHELPKMVLLNYFEKGAVEQLIDDFVNLNKNELLTEEFIEDIKQKLPQWRVIQKYSQPHKKNGYTKNNSICNEIYLNELRNRKKELDKVLVIHKLNHKQIPSRIIDFWLNIKEVKHNIAFSDRVKLMKYDCVQRLKTIRKHTSATSIKIPKVGEMASFLAKDIVNMIINEERKKKITSFYYDKLQQCIALFSDDAKRSEFFAIVNELQLNDLSVHPFFKNINFESINRTSQFYEAYLIEKAYKMEGSTNTSWIAKTFYKEKWNQDTKKMITTVQMPEDKNGIPFTILRWKEKLEQISDWKIWLNNIRKGKETEKKHEDIPKPIDLPTNLFDEKLIELLKNKLKESNIPFAPDSKLNELIKCWWNTRDDSSQDFYRSEREYKIYDQTVTFIPDKSVKFADYYSSFIENAKRELEKERNVKMVRLERRKITPITNRQIEKVFKRIIAGTEKRIRILQEEDKMTALMMEQLLSTGELIKLHRVQDLLNETIQGRLPIRAKLSFDENGKLIKNKNARLTIEKTITFKLKRKNQSLLRKYRYDRRLPELFEYFSQQEIPLDRLQRELRAYDDARMVIFDNIFVLEKSIVDIYSSEIENYFFEEKDGRILKKRGNIQHHAYLLFLLSRNIINTTEEQFLRVVRNCFSHNQFPHRQSVELIFPYEDESTTPIAELISEQYEKLINRITVNV